MILNQRNPVLNDNWRRAISSLSLMALLALAPFTACALTITVADQDVDALFAAVRDANEADEPAVIRLASNGNYEIDLQTRPSMKIEGNLKIEGNGATLQGAAHGGGYGELFDIGPFAQLELDRLWITGFKSTNNNVGPEVDALLTVNANSALILNLVTIDDIASPPGQFLDAGVIANYGDAVLTSVRITNVLSDAVGTAIYNQGEMKINNSLISDVFTIDDDGTGGTQIWNFGVGDVQVGFTTFLATSSLTTTAGQVSAIVNKGGLGVMPRASVFGSLLFDAGCPPDSYGQNFITDPSCVGLPSDTIGASPLPLEIGDSRGLTVVPGFGSPLVDRVLSSRSTGTCAPLDAIGVARPQDGRGDGYDFLNDCDIGGFERPAATFLASGQASGVYYDTSPGRDGHYLTIQLLRGNRYFVMWQTFDLNGRQAWIYGIGSSDSEVITLDAVIHPEGRLVPGQGAEVNLDAIADWGVIRIGFSSCRAASVAYESSLPNFGSGYFDIARIGTPVGIDCP